MSSRPHLSESAFLKREADQALSAAKEALNKAKTAAFHTVDPVAAAKRHPLIALGSAAVAGFITTIIAIPSKTERELRTLERLQRAMHPQPPVQNTEAPIGNEASNASNANGSHGPAKPTIGSMIAKEAFAFLKPIALALVTAKLKAEATPPPPVAPPSTADSH